MRLEHIVPGRPVPAELEGAVLVRDLRLGGERWGKGRRLTAGDLATLAAADPRALGVGENGVTVIVPGRRDVHEDDAARRLAAAVTGPGLEQRGPNESRVDLVAAHDGVVHVRVRALERLDRIDPLEVFTTLDGSVVRAGQLVASVKVAPHVVPASVVSAGVRVTRDGRRPLVWVAPFVERRVGIVVKESLRAADRRRFEAGMRTRVESLGSSIVAAHYVPDDVDAVEAALGLLVREPLSADVILTAGGRSTDPSDPFFVAMRAIGGRLIRRGVPAHPGSMLWLGRIGATAVMGLPTCGAYSRATAADLLLPRLLTGEPPSRRTVARLGHGGILTRDMRFRFPAYARDLDAPDG